MCMLINSILLWKILTRNFFGKMLFTFIFNQVFKYCLQYSAAPQPAMAPPVYQQPGSVPPYQQPGTTPGYYPTAPDPQGYPPQNAAYPPQNAAYPPPYPQQPQGYPPASNPYPYGAPTGQ